MMWNHKLHLQLSNVAERLLGERGSCSLGRVSTTSILIPKYCIQQLNFIQLTNSQLHLSLSSILILFRVSKDQLRKSRNQTLEPLKYNKVVKLAAYVNDVQGFYPYVDELKKHIFKFKQEDLRVAKSIFQSIKNKYRGTKHNLLPNSNVTMVSIHVRLTDFKRHLHELFNMPFITNRFLTKAMEYYHTKYNVSYSSLI